MSDRTNEIRVTRDVDLYGHYTGWMNVSADLDWWRRVLVHLPDDFPGAQEIAQKRLVILKAEGKIE